MKAVINSSPLISLSLVGKLDLLEKLYDEIIIPKSVYEEVVMKGKGKAGSESLASLNRFSVVNAININLKDTIMLELDEGEAEVITIAKEAGIQNVIIDEFAGRQYASLLGLDVIGTLGILVIGKKLRFIDEVKPLLDTLIKHNRYIDQSLYLMILKKTGEL